VWEKRGEKMGLEGILKDATEEAFWRDYKRYHKTNSVKYKRYTPSIMHL